MKMMMTSNAMAKPLRTADAAAMTAEGMLGGASGLGISGEHQLTLGSLDHLGWTVTWVIWKREMIRLFRQPTRIASAIGTPAMFWVFMGLGFSSLISVPGSSTGAAATAAATVAGAAGPSAAGTGSYALYLLPGMMTMVALFAAIFSSISVIEDRQEGWLQSVLVSPAPRWSIALGKIIGGATMAFLEAAILLLAPPIWGHYPSVEGIGLILAALALMSIMMTGIGFAFAWKSESTAGFHAVMSLVLMPMWALSGAIFPVATQGVALKTIMYLNPLTWASLAIGGPLSGDSVTLSLSISAACTLAAFIIAVRVVSQPGKAAP